MVVQLSRRAMLLYTILHSKPLYSAHFYVFVLNQATAEP